MEILRHLGRINIFRVNKSESVSPGVVCVYFQRVSPLGVRVEERYTKLTPKQPIFVSNPGLWMRSSSILTFNIVLVQYQGMGVEGGETKF